MRRSPLLPCIDTAIPSFRHSRCRCTCVLHFLIGNWLANLDAMICVKINTIVVKFSRFDRFTNSLWDLEMFFPMTIFWWFVFLGGPRTIPAWLPLRPLWAIFVICINPRWPPADMTKINYGSTCHKMMHNTYIMGFLGLQNPFLGLFFHFRASIRIFGILSNIWNVRVL